MKNMSSTGVTYYDEELKHLFRLLKALPHDIPSGNAHDFISYIPDPEGAKDFGSVQSVVSHSLEVSFGPSRDGVDITAPFFRDLLADSPVQGADAIRSPADCRNVITMTHESEAHEVTCSIHADVIVFSTARGPPSTTQWAFAASGKPRAAVGVWGGKPQPSGPAPE
ncbi:hypothetical protein B0H14DRAFT_3470499 [Mycena olivaceomarginata]|nr:hypothetical protein B0H14DRAFT_3470499 [Mycena olivaceomarginata]